MLPSNWTAPSWLKIELGIFTGRLYFEYNEHADLCNFFGVRESDGKLAEIEMDYMVSSNEQSGINYSAEQVDPDANNNAMSLVNLQELQSFKKKNADLLT